MNWWSCRAEACRRNVRQKVAKYSQFANIGTALKNKGLEEKDEHTNTGNKAAHIA